jgi:hypothetical protein
MWHKLELDRKGVQVLTDVDEYGKTFEYYEPHQSTKKDQGEGKRVKKVPAAHRVSHAKGHGRNKRVCVEKTDGTKIRLPHDKACEIVNAGHGKFIPKWQYKEEWASKRGNDSWRKK